MCKNYNIRAKNAMKWRNITKYLFHNDILIWKSVILAINVKRNLNIKYLYCCKWLLFHGSMPGTHSDLPWSRVLCTFLFDQYWRHFHSHKLALCHNRLILVYSYNKKKCFSCLQNSTYFQRMGHSLNGFCFSEWRKTN